MTKVLLLTVGLPRSGKTTWARQQGCPIVNPDSIRLSVHGQRYLPQAESLVWAIAKIMVRSLFKAGHERVIVDATNISSKRREQWVDPEWIVECHLVPTTKDECIRRAMECGDIEMVRVIERMAAEYEPFEV
jgi:predicted kinase